MDLNSALAIINFLKKGREMTDGQAKTLMDLMRGNLSISEMQYLYDTVGSPLSYHISEYIAEMEGLGRY